MKPLLALVALALAACAHHDRPPAMDAATSLAAEARFAAISSAQGVRAAHAALASSRLRFYREGVEPVVGQAAALASPAMPATRLAWKVERSETAKAGDLGYALDVVNDAPKS